MAGQLKLKDFLNPSKAKRKGDDDNDGGDEKKKKREEEDDKEKQAKAKTKRQFKSSWEVGREWLKYDSTKKVMFCYYSRERGNIVKSKAFINGTDSFKIDTIREHEGSQGHKDCWTGEMNAKKTILETPAGWSMSSLDQKDQNTLKCVCSTHV